MNRFKLLFIIFIIITTLGIYKIYFLNESVPQKQQTKPPSSILSVNAFLTTAAKTDNKLFITGTAFANEEVNLMAEIAGKLTMLRIPEGKVVGKGTLLAKINDLELQAELKKLKSENSLLKEKEIRNKKLLEINSISKEEYEATLNEYLVKKAEIELVYARIQKTEIRAPFTGLLGFKNIGPGSFVTPSLIIATIQQIDPIKIEFSIPEKYKSILKTGTPIRFSIEGSNEIFEAKIAIIEPKIDINTRTIKARAIYANRQNKIFPGAFVNLELTLKDYENSIMIPSEALIPILKGYKVFISKNGIAQDQEVVTGLRTDSEVQILKGLNAGDTLITSGIMSIKAGSKVHIIKLDLK